MIIIIIIHIISNNHTDPVFNTQSPAFPFD
jgi:hypothetical protein